VEYRILGPLEVVEDGNPVALGTVKERLVLAVLLLHANEFVSRERLIDDLWGEAPPPTAPEAVYVYVSKLRKALSAAGADPITTESGGYRLQIEPERLDSSRMQRLVGSAREHLAKSNLESAAAQFAEALSLWRGPTLAGLQLESRGRDEVAALDELRLAALMDRIDCDLALSRHEQVLGELGVLVSEHPLRERLRAQQMLALYRAERQADALSAYAEARRTLVDDLGIEPSEALQRLHQAILRHDPSLETPQGTAAVNGLADSAVTPPPIPSTDSKGIDGATPSRVRARRWQLALAALVLVAGSTAAADILSGSAGAHVVPDSLVRIDPRSEKIVSVIPVGAEPEQLAVTPTAVWTANLAESSVSRYDLRTHVLQSRGVPHPPYVIVANGRGSIWVSYLGKWSRIITRVGFTGGTSAGPLVPSQRSVIRVPRPGAVSLALGAGYLWAIAGPQVGLGIADPVRLIGFSRNHVAESVSLGPETTNSIVFGDGVAWIGATNANETGSTLSACRLTAERPRCHSYPLTTGDTRGPGPTVAVGDRKVWVLVCGDCFYGVHTQKLLEFDPGQHKVVKRLTLSKWKPNALAFGAGYVWVVSQAHASLLQLDPKTLRIVQTIRVGNPKTAAICGVAATRDAVWVTVGNHICENTFS
jgi:DNA-binding SARP family transcriptional activator